MKHVLRCVRLRMSEHAASGAAPDPEVLRLRTVHRAAAELRRGTPVLLTGEAPLVLLAAETAGPRGLAEFAALARNRRCCCWRRCAQRRCCTGRSSRARRSSRCVSAASCWHRSRCAGLADPTVEELLPAQPETGAGARTWRRRRLILAKLGRLLPAVLAAPLAGRMSQPRPSGWDCSAFRPPICSPIRRPRRLACARSPRRACRWRSAETRG